MYFWNIKSLVADLKANRVSSVQQLYYFLAISLLYAMAIEIAPWSGRLPGPMALTEALIVILFTVGGTYLAYRANGGARGKDFIARFIILSWPVSVRLILGVMLFYFVYSIFSDPLTAVEYGPVDVVAILIVEAVYYGWIARLIGEVAKANRSGDE